MHVLGCYIGALAYTCIMHVLGCYSFQTPARMPSSSLHPLRSACLHVHRDGEPVAFSLSLPCPAWLHVHRDGDPVYICYSQQFTGVSSAPPPPPPGHTVARQASRYDQHEDRQLMPSGGRSQKGWAGSSSSSRGGKRMAERSVGHWVNDGSGKNVSGLQQGSKGGEGGGHMCPCGV